MFEFCLPMGMKIDHANRIEQLASGIPCWKTYFLGFIKTLYLMEFQLNLSFPKNIFVQVALTTLVVFELLSAVR